VVAVAAALLLSLQALPALLRPPEPPPLGADVGLPRVVHAPAEPPPPAAEQIRRKPQSKHAHERRRRHRRTAKPSPPPPAPAPPPV